jgi:acylphosphatase
VKKRIRAVVRGDVQGVGFRAATSQEARRAEIAGWVRNLRDGSVEVEAEGTVQAVDGLIKWLRRGPSLARVTGVEIDDSLPPASLEGFTIRP